MKVSISVEKCSLENRAKKISKTKISFCAMKLIKKEVNKKKLK